MAPKLTPAAQKFVTARDRVNGQAAELKANGDLEGHKNALRIAENINVEKGTVRMPDASGSKAGGFDMFQANGDSPMVRATAGANRPEVVGGIEDAKMTGVNMAANSQNPFMTHTNGFGGSPNNPFEPSDN